MSDERVTLSSLSELQRCSYFVLVPPEPPRVSGLPSPGVGGGGGGGDGAVCGFGAVAIAQKMLPLSNVTNEKISTTNASAANA
jgi:hypothetical protein